MATTNHFGPSEADFARLEGELFARIATKQRGQTLRHRLVGAGVVLVLAGAGIAAGTVANPTQQTRAVDCYGGSTVSSHVVGAVVADATGNSSTKPSTVVVERAVTQCDELWKSGVFGENTVLTLQACLRDDLVLAVFPRKNTSQTVDQFCNNLDMSAP